MSLFARSSRRTRRSVWGVVTLTLILLVSYVGWYERHKRARPAPADAALAEPLAAGAQPPLNEWLLRARRPVEADTRLAAEPAPADDHDNPAAAPGAATPAGDTAAIVRSIAGEPEAIRAARSALVGGDLIAARRQFSAALAAPLDRLVARSVRGELVRLADQTLFSRRLYPGETLAVRHTVTAGENLTSIARRYRITDDLIAAVNQMPSKHRIAAGNVLKVIRGPFHAVIHKPDFRADVFVGGVLVRSLSVGLGANGSTPTGRWIVRDKLANPAWTDPVTREHFNADDPDNPIGEYWLGLEGVSGDALGRKGFGIHGTLEPESIGRQMSLGCVRLAPPDVEVLYRLLVSGDSTVEIVE